MDARDNDDDDDDDDDDVNDGDAFESIFAREATREENIIFSFFFLLHCCFAIACLAFFLSFGRFGRIGSTIYILS